MERKYRNIFMTVGTTRFDSLCEYVLKRSVLQALKRVGCEEVVFQIGNSSTPNPGEFTSEGIKFHVYRFKKSLYDDIMNADLVISHAGAGTCLEVLAENKPMLVVVNENLMDNHQLELAEKLQVSGHVFYCTSDTLDCTLDTVDFKLLKPFPKADPSLFIRHLDSMFRFKVDS